ncbi:MAG: hypothetical protein HY331_17800, partial [Chloroflexi bacterium]|nr:hypothetical protein [Chloroflexota bacterium]
TPTATPIPGTPLQHVVWLEDAASVRARLTLVDKHGIAGIAVWRLGQEDPAVWPLIQRWRAEGNASR